MLPPGASPTGRGPERQPRVTPPVAKPDAAKAPNTPATESAHRPTPQIKATPPPSHAERSIPEAKLPPAQESKSSGRSFADGATNALRTGVAFARQAASKIKEVVTTPETPPPPTKAQVEKAQDDARLHRLQVDRETRAYAAEQQKGKAETSTSPHDDNPHPKILDLGMR